MGNFGVKFLGLVKLGGIPEIGVLADGRLSPRWKRMGLVKLGAILEIGVLADGNTWAWSGCGDTGNWRAC